MKVVEELMRANIEPGKAVGRDGGCVQDTVRLEALQRWWEHRGGDCSMDVTLGELLCIKRDEDGSYDHETDTRSAIDAAMLASAPSPDETSDHA